MVMLDSGGAPRKVAGVPARLPDTCPICAQPVPPRGASEASDKLRPFCSSRCRLLDLSKWLSEDYAIPGPPVGDGGVDQFPDDDEDGL